MKATRATTQAWRKWNWSIRFGIQSCVETSFKTLLPLLFLLALPAVVQAEDYTYTTNNGTITITGYTGSGGDVTMPSTINGLPVSSIGDLAFYECASLLSITIPNSVTSIGGWAFEYTGLTSITIPNSVASIGGWAFSGCTSLANVTLGNSVNSIGDDAFYWCTSLTGITIPGSVTNIGKGAFGGCSSLRAITVDASNPVYSTVDGVLLDKSQTMLMFCPQGKAGSYTVPNSVASIGGGAFFGCTSLTSVTIPDSVTSIGNNAFSGCNGLNSVMIGNGVTIIGASAFYWCTSLTSVTIGTNVTSIADSAFAYCTSLTFVLFKGNAPSLGSYVFVYTGYTIPVVLDPATVYYLPGTTGWGASYGGCTTAILPLPAASNVTAGTKPNQPLIIPLAKLLLFASAPYGDPLSVSAVTPISTNGGTVDLSASAVTYTPPTGFIGSDQFNYTISDASGRTATAEVVVQVVSAPASTFTVTTTDDSGPGSLRQAIIDAIVNGYGEIVFSNVTGMITLLSRLPSLDANLTITGPGTNLLTISGNAQFQVFSMNPGTTNVLSGLTIANGSVNWGFGSGTGGGIYNAGDLLMQHCEVANCQSGVAPPTGQGSGGGIANDGNLRMEDCTVSGCDAQYLYKHVSSSGGGIVNGGDLRMEDCTVSGCGAVEGGGIYNGANLLLTNCIIESCRAEADPGDRGSGIASSGNLTIHSCIISNCSTSAGYGTGGAVASGGNLAITNSSIVNNWGWAFGGGLSLGGTNVMVGCTIAGNVCDSDGGGIYNGGELTMLNCTVSGNRVGYGGEMENGSTIYANHCTFFATNAYDYPRFQVVLNGGVFYAEDCIFAGAGTNCNCFSGELTSEGYNLIQDTNGCTIAGDETGNIYGVDPLLGPLQDNGGPTWTCELLLGSPAIDQGTSGGLTIDQRGVTRPYNVVTIPDAAGGDGSDIGAYEWTTPPAVPYRYTINNGTITITRYTGPGGAVTIPDTINGLPVTSIGTNAFYGRISLTSVTIPNTVTNIGNFALSSCGSLTAITVDALNPAYSSLDGVLFNSNQTILIQCPGGKAGNYSGQNAGGGLEAQDFFILYGTPAIPHGNLGACWKPKSCKAAESALSSWQRSAR